MNAIFSVFCLSFILLISPEGNCSVAEFEYGPFNVGFNSYKTYDYSRSYIIDKDTVLRPMLIHLWFPSQDVIEAPVLNFKAYIDLISLREDFDISKSEVAKNSFNFIKAYSDFAKRSYGLDTSVLAQQILDAPVISRSGIPVPKNRPEFPLLIYAPSNSKSSVQNHMICEYLASHGFMILSVGSAGPNSLSREKMKESIMAQVNDMEYILKYSEDSLHISYTNLGVFGFSSGGLASVIFQMRNERVDALLTMDGGQEYGAYPAIYKMPDFTLEKTDVPYCSVVNNYENFSIYPYYNSLITKEKYMFRMPFLDHNGFVSHWHFFESCSKNSISSPIGISYEYISKCALTFFSKYLKPKSFSVENSFFSEQKKQYIRTVSMDCPYVSVLCNALLDNDMNTAEKMVTDYKSEIFEDETRINILARMFIGNNIDLAIWLYKNNVEYHPDSWRTFYDLGYAYKEKGEPLLSRNALHRAEELNPGNADINRLLNEVINAN